MGLNQSLLPEFDHEMANTRKTLERIPDGNLAWQPHAKSMTMGHLALHLADIPSWVGAITGMDQLDLGTIPHEPKSAASSAEAVALFDKNVGEAREALAGASDEHLLRDWALLSNGRTIFTLPRIAVIRSMVMNHAIHHRAQLGVYLRLNDIPVPSTYGPSADEGQVG